MGRARVQRIVPALAMLAGIALMLRSAFPMEPGIDYFVDGGPSIDALARGDWQAFFDQHALMGSVSLMLRAPFVLPVFDGSLQAVYFAGVIPCFAAVVALAVALRRRMIALGRPALAVTVVGVVALLNPGVIRSIHWGHPEELLGGALCVGAILASLRGRWLVGGALLGLAIGTKQWAAIAVIPALLASADLRRAAGLLAVATVVAAAFTLPSILASPAEFVSVHKQVAVAGGPVGPPNVWWPFSTPRDPVERAAGARGFADELPNWLSSLTHPMIVLAGVPLGLLFWRRRRSLAREDVLGLFALLMLLRCVLDPWNNDYYHLPFLLALLAWEALARDGWPRVTVLAGAALALTFPASIDSMSAMTADSARYCFTYLAWALPLTAWLSASLFAPGLLRRRGLATARPAPQVG